MMKSRFYGAELALCCLLLLTGTGSAHGKMSVIDSPHNLSASGGRGRTSGLAGVSLSGETRICIFCHVPHNATAGTPLWNRTLPSESTDYKPYQSSTINANPRPEKPTGASRLCLSCHDGTIALSQYGGSTLIGATMMPNEAATINPNLTTDLSDDHPISFAYTEALALQSHLASPSTLPGRVRLEQGVNLECTACHDPHDNQYGNFLVMNNSDPGKPDYAPGSPLCVTCHKPPNWDASTHNPAITPALANGCLNCHAVHNAPGAVRLLRGARQEDTCVQSCHNGIDPGSVNVKNLLAPGLFRHPVDDPASDEVHDENEALPAQKYHVQCVDCHNPHQANAANAPLSSPPLVNGRLKGVRKDSLGSEATMEYEICFKCHAGDYANRFAGVTETMSNRMIEEPNQFNRFDSLNPSFHPVTADRRTNGASLLTSLQATMTRIYCTDCHNSDQSAKAGGSGANGPHGSQYEHILIAQYNMPVAGTSIAAYNQSQYLLCYRCHSENYVMTAGSAFANAGVNEHSRHVRDRLIPCFACHDPHGTPWKMQATAINNAHLINFDKGYAAGAAVANPQYVTLSTGTGSCTVNCHTTADNTESYSPSGATMMKMRRSIIRIPTR